MQEPGLDRREWESEWRALEPLVVDAPDEALPELDRLLERMIGDQREAELEVLAGFRAAREIARRVERGEEVDPAEVGQTVGLYRELYEHLLQRASDTS
jgi:hypothetical protein